MLRGSWVQIPALYTGWTFFTIICCKNCNDVCLKRPKINEKEAGVGPFFKKERLLIWAVVVAQLVEWLLPVPVVRSSNTVISKKYIEHLLSTVLKR